MRFMLGLLIGASAGVMVGAIAKDTSVSDEQTERQPTSIAMSDLLILCGSEGDNLPGPEAIYTRDKKPGLDYRAEVAEQLGCEDDKPKSPDGITFAE